MDYVVNTVAAGGISAHAVLGVFDIGSCFDACLAGYIETVMVTIIEHKAIIKIEFTFISEGILLKK